MLMRATVKHRHGGYRRGPVSPRPGDPAWVGYYITDYKNNPKGQAKANANSSGFTAGFTAGPTVAYILRAFTDLELSN